MEAPKEPFLEDGERCWKEGEGQSHLPVWWGGGNRDRVLE